MPSSARSTAPTRMPTEAVPPVVGTLVGESTSTEFRLAIKAEAVREQDLIAVDAEVHTPVARPSTRFVCGRR